MDTIRNGWFSEISDDLWPGQCFSLKVNKVLHEETSAFQSISILETCVTLFQLVQLINFHGVKGHGDDKNKFFLSLQ